MTWHEQRLAGLDIETTGVDLDADRIVAAAISILGGGRPPEHHYWIVDPGVDIPADATAIHGITTERARAEGRHPQDAVREIITTLTEQSGEGVPVVAFNARFDFTVLDREAVRYGLPGIASHTGTSIAVIDPYVLDKQFDRFRRGKRTLTAACEHYRVSLDLPYASNTHAIAATLLALRLVGRVPELRAVDPTGLHRRQIDWAAGQAASMEEYLRREGCQDRVEHAWPIVPTTTQTRGGPIRYRRAVPGHPQHDIRLRPSPSHSETSPSGYRTEASTTGTELSRPAPDAF
jgi:DNA polymerase-3 subunit epsilon